MNLKCGYFTVGGIMCGSLVGIFVGALAVNASLGYMILLLGDEEALESMAYTRPPRVRPPKSKKKGA